MAKSLKQHSMRQTAAIAQRAAAEVTQFMADWPHTVAIHNVEQDTAYQPHDVDLLWSILDGHGRLRVIPVEIKGDRYHQTGNFFFETVSNAGKNTPGCFLYTRAKWLFYLFVDAGTLYCLPMSFARPWFLHNQDRFTQRQTSTPVGSGRYITIGSLVPIDVVLAEVDGVLRFQKQPDASWQPLPIPRPPGSPENPRQ